MPMKINKSMNKAEITINSIMRTRWVSTATDPKLKPLFGNVLLNTMSFGSSPEVCKPCLHKIIYIVNTVKFSMICVYVSLHQIIIWNTCENVCMVTILTRKHPSVARSLRDYNIWENMNFLYSSGKRQDNLFPSLCDGGRTKPKKINTIELKKSQLILPTVILHKL